MAYIPADGRWRLADLIVEFAIGGERGKVVHYNLTLVRADSAEEAYAKAVGFGERHEDTYTNTNGLLVKTRFRGLRDLTPIYEDLEDGAELLYEEGSDVTEDRILAAIKPKEKLAAFEPYVPSRP
jgi:hypothetical protein